MKQRAGGYGRTGGESDAESAEIIQYAGTDVEYDIFCARLLRRRVSLRQGSSRYRHPGGTCGPRRCLFLPAAGAEMVGGAHGGYSADEDAAIFQEEGCIGEMSRVFEIFVAWYLRLC